MAEAKAKRPGVMIRTDPVWHRKIKILAAKRGVSIRSLVEAAVASYLAKPPS